MAAIMRRRNGLPCAIVMRSGSTMVGSCHGASSSSPPAIGSAKAGSAAAGRGGGVAACSARKPAKKPFSQSRCSGEKGALSGMKEAKPG